MVDRSRSPRQRDRSPSPRHTDDVLNLARARKVAVEAVLAACKLTSKVQETLTDDAVAQKADLSPVTVADLGAQAIITRWLLDAFPSIPLMGEEDASELHADAVLAGKVVSAVQEVMPDISAESVLEYLERGNHAGGRGLFWVLDPVDGTKGFLRREQYAVCLGLIKDGRVLVAVLGCPNLPVDPTKPEGERGCLFIAVEGEGACQHDISNGLEKRISVSSASDSSEARCVESVDAGHSDHGSQAAISNALGMKHLPTRMDSQCKFAVVARGEASLYLRFGSKDQKIWDIAAGAMIVEEAGGKVSDAEGSALNFAYGRTIGASKLFASNGLIHADVIRAIQNVQRGV